MSGGKRTCETDAVVGDFSIRIECYPEADMLRVRKREHTVLFVELDLDEAFRARHSRDDLISTAFFRLNNYRNPDVVRHTGETDFNQPSLGRT